MSRTPETKIFRRRLALRAGLALAVLAGLTASPPRAVASEEASRGQAWLLAHVQADGSWRSARDPSGLRSTARALLALGAQAPVTSPLWLAAQQARSLEESAEAALALGRGTPAPLLLPVTTHRVAEGQWGSAPGEAADPFHTALALTALAYTGTGKPQEVAAGADYLARAQNADGSWSARGKGQETSVVTAAAVRALLACEISSTQAGIQTARQWLLGHQGVTETDWGAPGTGAVATAEAIGILRWLGLSAEAESAAVSYLTARQQFDGAWEADPWTTATVSSSLARAGLADLAFAVGGVAPSPNPVPGDPWELRVHLGNRGTATVGAAVVRFVLRDGAGAVVSQEDRTLEGLAGGQEASVTFPVATAALNGSYAWTVQLDPDDLVREGDELDNVRQGTLEVGGWRNLSVAAGGLRVLTADGLLPLDPATLPVGTKVLLVADVSVAGTHGAGPVEVWFYWGDPANGGRFLGSAVLTEIPVDGTVRAELPWTVDETIGAGALWVTVDPRRLLGQTESADDRLSLASGVVSRDDVAPQPPSGLMARIVSRQHVDVAWWASPSPDVVGYRVYRDGVPINARNLAPESTPSASDSYNLREYLPDWARGFAEFDPPNLTDGNPDTSWWSIQYPYEEWEPEPCFVQFDFPKLESFRGIVIDWFNFDLAGKRFRIQAWNGQEWQDLKEVRDNVLMRTVVILDEAFITDKVRIQIDEGLNRQFVAIREVQLLEAGPGRVIPGLSTVDDAIPGLPAAYTVTAVDAAGNESAPSKPFVLRDQSPPVVKLTAPVSGQRLGPEIFVSGTVADEFLQGYALDWFPGEHLTDVVPEWNRAAQRGDAVHDGPLFTWHPPQGIDGPVTLRLWALDGGGVGNIREQRVVVHVDTVPPARPVGVTFKEDARDPEVLVWEGNREADLAGYIVWMNGDKPGQKDVTKEGTASASASYADAFVNRSPAFAVDNDEGTFWRPPAGTYPCWWRLDFSKPKSVCRVELKWKAPMLPGRFAVETLGADGLWVTRWSVNGNEESSHIVRFATTLEISAVRVVVYSGAVSGDPRANAPTGFVEPPAPFPALAEVNVSAQEMVTTARFETRLEPGFEYGLTVQAVDDVGNRSSMSQAAVLDTVGPRVQILSPKPGEALGRTVVIEGIAEDRYFREYVLEVAEYRGEDVEPGPWEEIHRSNAQVGPNAVNFLSELNRRFRLSIPEPTLMTVWYPTLRKGSFILRLTAWDVFDHKQSRTRVFSLDAMPPEPPSNLTAALSGPDVALAWQPSVHEADGSGPAADLDGYRVYRDMIPLTVKDVAFLGKVVAPEHAGDLNPTDSMNDGCAFTAWMPEPFVQPVDVYLDLPQPFSVSRVGVEWGPVEWLWGNTYAIDVWDKTAGQWVVVADVHDSIAPEVAHDFAPLTTDRVRIRLLEGMTPFSVGAIGEIHVYRHEEADLLKVTTYTDTGAQGLEGAYRVTALDRWGNESPKSNRVVVDTVAPRVALAEPAAGELRFPAGTIIAVKGTAEDTLLREWRVELGRGKNPDSWQLLAQQQGDLRPVVTPQVLATWTLPSPEQGWFTIRLTARDEGGRTAEDRRAVYIDTLPPPQPQGLAAVARDGGVGLDWQAVADAGLAGYHVYRNGKRLDIEDVAVNGVPKASSFYCGEDGCFPAAGAVDGTPYTKWRSMDFQIPAWLRLSFDGNYPISRVSIDFDPWQLARDFTIQRWDEEASGCPAVPEHCWVDVASASDFERNPYEVTFPEPVRFERFRLRMTEYLADLQVSFGVREVHLFRAPGAETPTQPAFFDDAVSVLEYTYRVTAVDTFGNESLPSNDVSLDALLPRVTVTAPVEEARVGAHVEVEGTVEEWRLLEYRLEVGRGQQPSSFEVAGVWERPREDAVLAVWDPPAGEDGWWTIRLVARDLSGHETAVERRLWVDTTPPPSPSGLTASAIGTSTVDLRWNPVVAPDLDGYLVYRDDVLLNDPVVSHYAEATASVSASSAGSVLDGEGFGGWGGRAPCSWEARFPGNVRVDQVEVYLTSCLFCPPPANYEFQVFDGQQWKTVSMTWDNPFFHRIQTIGEPAQGSRFRIFFTDPGAAVGLRRVRLWDHARGGPVKTPSYLDQGLTEIGWSYEVSAVDLLGNESPKTPPLLLDSTPPVVSIASPTPGAPVASAVAITGTVNDVNLSYWRLQVGSGAAPAQWQEIAFGTTKRIALELARWTPPAGTDAPYTFRLVAEDGAGNVGKTTVTVQVKTAPPPMPGGLAAQAVQPDGQGKPGSVSLTWGAPTGAAVAGYNVYRDGVKLNAADLAPSAQTSSSAGQQSGSKFGPEATVDGDSETYWVPKALVYPAWIAFEFGQQHRIGGVVLEWVVLETCERYVGVDYQIQYRRNGQWQTAVFVENNEDVVRADPFPQAVTADAIRIWITRGMELDLVGALREVKILSAEGGDLVASTGFVDGGLPVVEGVYTVTAVDPYGNESVAATRVVDAQPPRITISSPEPGERVPGQVTIKGRIEERTLSELVIDYRLGNGPWNEGAHLLAPTSVTEIATLYVPSSVHYEGPAEVRVRAWDKGGNASETIVPVFLDTVAPDAPATVTASAGPGAVAHIAWTPSQAGDVAGYFVRRRWTTLNPGNLVEGGVASASDVYEDSMYHQPWSGIDSLPETAWWSAMQAGPRYFEVAFPHAASVKRITVAFYESKVFDIQLPPRLRLEAFVGGQWLTLVEDASEVTLPEEILADRVRVVMWWDAGILPFAVGVREFGVFGSGMVTTPEYWDYGLDSQETCYDVIAVDGVGNKSPASAPAYVDTAAPRVSLLAPAAGAATGTPVAVQLAVEDPNLTVWGISWGEGADPSTWTPLKESGVFSGYDDARFSWDAQGRQGPVTLRLWARDGAGNEAKDQVTFTVDGNAPPAVAGLTASASSAGVSLSWGAAGASDLAGYLVYRDGKLLNGDDVAPLGTAWATYADRDRPAAQAVDGRSDTCWSGISQPDGLLIWGLDFEEPLPVAGVELWLDLVTRSVFVEGWTGAEWQVLATMSDNTSKHRLLTFDPVHVSRLRLRFPAIDGGTASARLAEVRVLPGGSPGASTESGFLDAWLSAPLGTEHGYTVVAVDSAGNRSSASEPVVVDALPPRVSLDAPVTGQLVGSSVAVKGQVHDRFLQTWALTAALEGVGTVAVAEGTSVPAGGLAVEWHPPAGWVGNATLVLSASDTSGHTASISSAVLVDTQPPGAPAITGVTDDSDGLRVHWTPPADADVAGYVVYRDGEPLQAADLTHVGFLVSNGLAWPQSAFDGNPATSAWNREGTSDVWLGVQFATWHTVRGLRFGPSAPLGGTSVQVLRDGEWQTVVAFTEAARPAPNADFLFERPVVGQGVRLYMPVAGTWGPLYEMAILGDLGGLQAGTVFRDQLLEDLSVREASYEVAAVDQAGNEGPRSAPMVLDVVPPRVTIVTPATGTLIPGTTEVWGSAEDPRLSSWSLEVSYGGGGWEPVANGSQPVAGGRLASWSPKAGVVGPASLRLSASDSAGNQSQAQVSLMVDAAPPAAPGTLVAQMEPGGGVHLSWNPAAEGDLAGYRIYRNGHALVGALDSWTSVTDGTGVALPEAVDRNPATSKYLWGSNPSIEFTFDYLVPITEVRVTFDSSRGSVPTQATLEIFGGAGWVTVAEMRGNRSPVLKLLPSGPAQGKRFRVVCRARAGNYYVAELEAFSGGLPQDPTFSLSGLAQYEDAYTVTAVDLAGNESALSAPAVLDSTPPVTVIHSPAAGAWVGSVYGFSAQVTVDDLSLDHWTLSFGRGEAPSEWQPCTSGTTRQLKAWVGQCWSYLQEEGVLTFRLAAVDTHGSSSEARVSFHYDGLPPRASLSAPHPYWPPGEAGELGGLLEDLNLASAEIGVAHPGETDYMPVAAWKAGAPGLPKILSTTGWAEGVTRFRMTARDVTSNYGTAYLTVDVAPVQFLGESLMEEEPLALAVAGDEVWSLNAAGQLLHRSADHSTWSVLPGSLTSPAGGYPKDLVAAGDRLWVLGYWGLTSYSLDGYPVSGVPNLAYNSYTRLARRGDGVFGLLQGGEVDYVDGQGTKLAQVMLPGPGLDLDFDRFGNCYVLNGSGTVYVVDPSGILFATLTNNWYPGPTRIAVDREGRIVLGGGGEGRMVKVLSPGGQLLSAFGLFGSEPQTIQRLVDVAVQGDRALVLDADRKAALEFLPILPIETPAVLTAKLDAPAGGAVVHQGVNVVGTAWSQTATAWVLEKGQGLAPTTWQKLGQGNGALVGGALAPWDTRTGPDGPWTLRLTVTGQAGETADARLTVTVDNQPPTVAISAPAPGARLTGTVPVSFSVADANLVDYELTVQRPGGTAPAILAHGSVPTAGTATVSWDASAAAPGFYLVSLAAKDVAGNAAHSEVSVSVGGVVYLGDVAAGVLTNPTGIGRMPDGGWLLSSDGVRVLSPSGDVRTTITQTDQGATLGGSRAAALPDGRIVIVSSTTKRAVVYDAAGNALFGFTGPKPGFQSPVDVAVDSAGRIVVLDRGCYSPYPGVNVGYHVFDSQGGYLYSVTGRGSEPGQFLNPVALGVDGAGDVYVLDGGNNRVQVFDPSGTFLNAWAMPVQTYQYWKDIAVDASGAFAVVASYSDGGPQVWLFQADGAALASWGEWGSAAGQLNDPTAAWLEGGKIWVAEKGRDLVSIFDVSQHVGTSPTEPTAKIAAPVAGGLLPARLRLLGTAAGSGVVGYRVEAAAAGDPTNWRLLATVPRPVANGVLAAVDLSTLPAGAVTLKLTLEGVQGAASDEVVCVLDPTPPALSLDHPEPFGLLREGEPVRVTVTDDGPVSYRVQMGYADDSGTHWSNLLDDTGPAQGRPVAWSAGDFPAGVYTVRVAAVDEAGNRTVVEREASTSLLRYVGDLPLPATITTGTVRALSRDGDGLLLATTSRYYFLDSQGIDVLPDIPTEGVPDDVTRHSQGFLRIKSQFCFDPIVLLEDHQGGTIRTFGTGGVVSCRPTSVAEDATGRVLVGDGVNLAVFSPGGVLQAKHPIGRTNLSLGVDAFNNWYWLGGDPARFDVLDAEGRTVWTFGDGLLVNGSQRADVDTQGRAAVLGIDPYSSDNRRLTVVAPDGRLLGVPGGNARAWLKAGVDVAWGADGRIYVLCQDRIRVFDPAALFPSSGDPVAHITAPADGMWAREKFPVIGTAWGGGTYSLLLQGPSGEFTVSTGNAVVADGVLGMVDAAALPDGDYMAKLLVDGASGPAETSVVIHVDKASPEVSLSPTLAFAAIREPTSVTGHVSDAALQSWVLEVDYLDWGVRKWKEIARGTTTVDGELAVLDPALLTPGTYTLRLTATDTAGHVSSTATSVSVGAVRLVSSAAFEKGYVGASGGAEGTIVAQSDGSMFVTVTNGTGVHHLAADGALLGNVKPAALSQVFRMSKTDTGGVALFGWDPQVAGYRIVLLDGQGSETSSFLVPSGGGPGRIGDQMPQNGGRMAVAAGRIFLLDQDEVEVFDLQGNYLATWGERADSTTQDPGEFVSLTNILVDPFGRVLVFDFRGRVLIYSLDGSYRGEMHLVKTNGWWAEANFTAVDHDGNIAVFSTFSGGDLFRYDGKWLATIGRNGYWGNDSWNATPGTIMRLGGVSFDKDGVLRVVNTPLDHEMTRLESFAFDRKAFSAELPAVSLHLPAEGAKVSAESWISGKIAGVEPLSWDLFVGEGTNPSYWAKLAQGSEAVPARILSRWSSEGHPDGLYTLRLRATDGTGSTTEVLRSVTLDATPPVIAWTSPVDRAMVPSGQIGIEGTIQDARARSYAVKYLGTDTYWHDLARGTTFPPAGRLATWYTDALGTNVYRLKMWALDEANNLTVASRDVSIGPVEFVAEKEIAPDGTLMASASRDGRIALARPGRQEVELLDADLNSLGTTNLPVPAGWSGIGIEKISFAADGDLVVVGSGWVGAELRRRVLWIDTEGTLTGQTDLVSPSREWWHPDYWVQDLAVLPSGDAVVVSVPSYGGPGEVLQRYSRQAGFVGEIPAPTGRYTYRTVIARHPNGIVLGGPTATQILNLVVIDEDGGVLSEFTPAGGWNASSVSSVSVDGAGSVYASVSGPMVEKFSPGGSLLWTTGARGSYPGRRTDYAPVMLTGKAGRWYELFPSTGWLEGFRAHDGAVDDTPPVVTVTPPANGGLTNNNTPQLTYAVSDGTVVVKVDATVVSKTLGQALDTLADGPHMVTVEATDAAGNKGTASVTFTVDTVPPAVAITSPANGSLTNSKTPALAYTMSDGTVVVTVDGSVVAKTSGQVSDALADGPHSVTVEATDAAGNKGTASATFTVDTVPPAVAITSPGNGSLINNKTPAFVYTVSDGTVVVKVDGVVVGKASGQTLDVLADGPHTVTVEATDAAGNKGTASVSFTVDTVPPTVGIDSVTSPVRQTAVTLTGTREIGATVTVSIAQGTGTAGPVTTPTGTTWECALSGLASGTYQVQAAATDAAHNVGAASASFMVNLNRPPTLDAIGAKTVAEGEYLSFPVTTNDPDGTTSTVTAVVPPNGPLPEGASFDGATFRWIPNYNQAGAYSILFSATDGEYTATQTASITVTNVDRPPTVPIAVSPRARDEVTTLRPALAVEPSTDRDGDSVRYDFELYGDERLTAPVASATSVAQTTWTVPTALSDHAHYFWRARASDGTTVSQWSEPSAFFVNLAQEAPTAPVVSLPSNGWEVATTQPTLVVDNATDPDEGRLTYAFTVFADERMTTPVAHATGLSADSGGTTSWTVSPALADQTWYTWRAYVRDEHGIETAGVPAAFYVDMANHAPTTPAVLAPAAGAEVAASAVDLVVANATDADGQTLGYSFELDTAEGFGSVNHRTSGTLAAGAGTTTWHVTGLSDHTVYYWRAKASDGQAESGWAAGSFFPNTANEAPSAPIALNPGAGAWVNTVTPRLAVAEATNPDRDRLTYEFQVYQQPPPASAAANGTSAVPEWVVSPALSNHTAYSWRVRAVDEHGLAGAWTALTSLHVSTDGGDDPPAVTVTEPASPRVVPAGGSQTIQWALSDPGAQATISLYYDTDNNGFNGTLLQGGLAASRGSSGSYAWTPTGVPAGTYWVYATIGDGASSRSSYGLGSVTLAPAGDSDADGVPDSADNCPTTYNPDQLDSDQDGMGNACDPDNDNDGFTDAEEIAAGSDPLNAASVPQTNLSVTLTDAPDPVTAGNNVTYTITATNNGPWTALGVQVTLNLPATGVTFVSASPSQLCSGGVPTVTCDLGRMGASTFSTITVVVKTVAGARTLSSTAHVHFSQPDPNPDDDSATASTTVWATGMDLIETTVSNPPATAVTGSSFAVTDTAQNLGVVASAAATTRYYLSTDTAWSSGDKLLTGTRSVPALGANGATSTGTVPTVTIPTGTAVGAYYLLACADDLKVVTESDETNNCVASPTTVAVTLPAPDLIETVVSAPASVTVGVGFSATDTAKNQGTAATAAASTTRYYLSADAVKDASDKLLTGTRTVVSGLAAGVSSPGSATVTLPSGTAAGTYYLLACADDTNTVAESNETNNCIASTSTVSVIVLAPDLIETVVSAPASVTVGVGFSTSDTAKNQGTAATSAASTTRYYLSADTAKDASDKLLTATRTVASGLAAGATSPGSATVTLPSGTTAGTYYLLACADDLKVVTESDETNNCIASTSTVSVVLPAPDLIETAVSAPASVTVGVGFSTSDTAKNQGTAATSAASTTRYYLSADTAKDASDKLLTATRTVASGLAAGVSSPGSATVTIPSGTAVGTYYLLACADDTGAVAESNETNNCFASTSFAVKGPDLVETSVTNPPATIKRGSAFSVTDTAKNQGNASTAAAATTRYYLGLATTHGASDTLLTGTRSVASGLAAGATSSNTVRVTVPSTTVVGSYYLFACADDTGTVAETNETNNCLVSATKVQVTQ